MRATGLILFLLSGCQTFGGGIPAGRPVMEAHAGSQDLRILDVESPLKARRKIPVLRTPEVFAAYVPAHVERDVLIGDHWIYFKLKDAEFFVEEIQDPDVPFDGEAPVELLKQLESVEWSRGVVPHVQQ